MQYSCQSLDKNHRQSTKHMGYFCKFQLWQGSSLKLIFAGTGYTEDLMFVQYTYKQYSVHCTPQINEQFSSSSINVSCTAQVPKHRNNAGYMWSLGASPPWRCRTVYPDLWPAKNWTLQRQLCFLVCLADLISNTKCHGSQPGQTCTKVGQIREGFLCVSWTKGWLCMRVDNRPKERKKGVREIQLLES